MWTTKWTGAIKHAVIPLSGVGLAFYLAFQPGERPSLVVLAALMMGFPLASVAEKLRSEESKKEEEDA